MATISIDIKKASPIGDQNIPDVHIHISDEFPEFVDLKKAELLHQKQAKDIAEGLKQSLPGGTFDRLVSELVSASACLLKIAHKF